VRTRVIVNPRSADGATGREWRRLGDELERAIGAFEVTFTGAPGDATRICREALRAGCRRIIAVGGDGTLSETVNGFFSHGEPVSPEAVFGFIMRGRGNDFRRSLGIAHDPEEYIRRIAGGNVREIDLGKITYLTHEGVEASRIFDNIVTLGMGGEVDRRVNESRAARLLGGTGAFLLATLTPLVRYRNRRIRLCVDDAFERELRIRLVAVANGRYAGGGMLFAPQAELDDGLFDVVVIGDLGRWETMRHLPALYSGKMAEHPEIFALRGRVITATSPEEVLIDVDGEPLGRLPVSIEVLPRALRVLC